MTDVAFNGLDVDADDGTVSTLQLIAYAGITYRQADYWTRTGILHPVRAWQGSGVPRRYTRREADLARALGRITEALDTRGSRPSPIRLVVDRLRAGETTFELAPGITIDLERLVGSDTATLEEHSTTS
jgi:hypothetical protein